MKNILKENNGSALAMIIIVSTVSIMLLTTLANLAFHNYKFTRATNKESNAYYIVDLGMEKTLKEIETIVESGKIYANQKIRTDDTLHAGLTAYEYFVQTNDINQFKTDYENFYKEYLTDTKFQTASTIGFEPLGDYSELKSAQYRAIINTASFNANYMINIGVTGNDGGTFERKIDAEIGLNPWGYDSNGNAIDPDANDINLNEDAVYESPQWANAIASSGDVVVRGGTVTVDGDIHVDGKVTIPTGNEVLDGTEFGGLIVGKYGQAGHLTVNGNIFTNNYVHTMAPNSTITVNTSSSANLDNIYNTYENATYLTSNSSDPLNIGSLLIGTKQANNNSTNFKDFINYIKNTYKIQKQNGGFVYANSIQIEKEAINSNITIDGSTILFDNLSINGDNGQISIDKNFYGFKSGGSVAGEYDKSSSIALNNKSGQVSFGQRIYSAGTAYVTAFDASGVPYQTAESISMFKNYYGYRIPLTQVTERTGPVLFTPFRFFKFNNFDYQKAHVFEYNNTFGAGVSISDGGIAYDKDMIKLNHNIYDTAKLGTEDMGYTLGVLMGKNTNNNNFIGVISPDGVNPHSLIQKSQKSLTKDAFDNYIADKYNTLMEIKSLKTDNGSRITIDQLVDDSIINGWDKIYPTLPSSGLNYIVVDGDITIGTSGSTITATTPGGTSTISNTLTYNGLILATGKITVNPASNITINGAIISTADPNNVGVEFIGSSSKTVKFDKNILITIFRLPMDDAKSIKDYLTSQRGIVKIFTEAYYNDFVTGFKAGVDAYTSSNSDVDTPEEKIEEIAYLYEITDSDFNTNDKTLLSFGIVNTTIASGSRNYKVFKWKTIN